MPSISDNHRRWNDEHDWSRRGEEWTPDEVWRREIVKYGITPYLLPGMDVLEIGPGRGRWTVELLRHRPGSLVGVELSECCVELCRERFSAQPHARFLQNDGRSLDALPDAAFDFVWSFDVFVHMEADVIRAYFEGFRRVLRPGAVGTIHYPSLDRATSEDPALGWRGRFTSTEMRALVDELGLELLHDHYDPMISSTNSSAVVFRR